MNAANTHARSQLRIAADHPALPGHFPGHPIVPGVVLLDEVIAAAHSAFGIERVTAIEQAKFLAPLPPDTIADIELALSGAHLRFTITCAAGIVARGVMSIVPP